MESNLSRLTAWQNDLASSQRGLARQGALRRYGTGPEAQSI